MSDDEALRETREMMRRFFLRIIPPAVIVLYVVCWVGGTLTLSQMVRDIPFEVMVAAV